MCWNFKVSVAFAILEALGIGFIFTRAMKSKDPFVRGQLYVIPILMTIFLVESCEALLWLDESLVSVTLDPHAENSKPCSSYNRNITLFIWLFVVPIQPFCFLYPCRRVFTTRTKYQYETFRYPEYMAILYFVLNFLTYLEANGLHLESSNEDAHRSDIQLSRYRTNTNTETCSYIGVHHHLYWTFKTLNSWTVPNGFTYAIISVTGIFARPWKFVSGIYLFNITVCLCILVSFKGTMELPSVWCWSGISCHLYFILQPYVLPIKMESNNRSTIDEHETNLPLVSQNDIEMKG